MNQITKTLEIKELKPFPLDVSLGNLPSNLLQQFAELYELVKGYTRSLPAYQTFEADLIATIDAQISTINEIIALLEEYTAVSLTISGQVKTMEDIYKEFINLETYQYQLLSSNFNQNFLKLKFAKLTVASDADSVALVSDFRKSPGKDLSSFLREFKDGRKLYHLRKEKLNRWNEERVGGFI